MNMSNITYHREKPVREFDLNQTMYTTIKSVNESNQNIDAIGFLGKNITYGELFKRVDRLADAYHKAGVQEGDTIAIATINMPIVQENLLALSKLGVTSKWIDLRAKKAELIKNINESNCKIIVIFEGITPLIEEIINETSIEKVIVASPKDKLNPLIKNLPNLKDKKEGKLIELPQDRRFVSYEDFYKTGATISTLKAVSFIKERPSIIVQSSGSTGKAKSIVHTEYNFNSEMQKEAYTDLPFATGKCIHVAIPPFIIYGLCNSTYASLAFGMKAEMTPYVSENTVFDDLGKFDFACAAPLHYRYIYNKITELQDEIKKLSETTKSEQKLLLKKTKELAEIFQKLGRASAFISGGDKITVDEILKMQHLFSVPIVNGYGNNEMTGAAIISPLYAQRPSSIGVPLKGIKVATFDPETGEKLEDGVEGELCFNSDSVFVEYLNNPEETSKIKQIHDGEEWIHTGDIGRVDEEGYVFISGRSKRLIKRMAFKISPDTIESVIMTIPEVKDCVVVGVPDEVETEVPMAFIELNNEYNEMYKEIEAKILIKCQEELPDYEIPKHIQHISEIPYQNGKKAFRILQDYGTSIIKSTSIDSSPYAKIKK